MTSKCHIVTPEQQVKRRDHCIKLRGGLTTHSEKTILWSDETMVDVNAFKNQSTDCVLTSNSTSETARAKNPQEVMALGVVTSD